MKPGPVPQASNGTVLWTTLTVSQHRTQSRGGPGTCQTAPQSPQVLWSLLQVLLISSNPFKREENGPRSSSEALTSPGRSRHDLRKRPGFAVCDLGFVF